MNRAHMLLRVLRERISLMSLMSAIGGSKCENAWDICLTCRHCLKRSPKQQPSSKSLQPLLEILSFSLHVTQGIALMHTFNARKRAGKINDTEKAFNLSSKSLYCCIPRHTPKNTYDSSKGK